MAAENEGAEPTKALSKRNILIVDDVAFFRNRVHSMVEGAGCGRVVECGRGKEAIALFHDGRFDLVLLDVALPDTDGLSVLQVIRRLDPDATVIIVTAAASADVVRQARRAGAAAVLVKPVEKERLLSAIADSLKRKSDRV